VLSYVDQGRELEGRALHELASEAGEEDVDCLLDLLSAHDGRILAIYHWPAERNGEDVLRRTLTHPLFMGASDGIFRGSRPHRRGFGTFPRILGDYVHNGALTLEAAVHTVTGRPAQRFKIAERGCIKPGHFADLAIFDARALADTTTWLAPRLQTPAVRSALVNGETVLEEGVITDRLPGRVLRRAA
jgi:N-acyl-D-amino-acid deacylase